MPFEKTLACPCLIKPVRILCDLANPHAEEMGGMPEYLIKHSPLE